jgi:hypothetical protein
LSEDSCSNRAVKYNYKWYLGLDASLILFFSIKNTARREKIYRNQLDRFRPPQLMFKIAPVILGVLALSPPNIALVADSSAIIKAVTVSITTTNSNGSGVIIKQTGNKYTILTAAHVVRNTQQVYSIGTADGQKYQIGKPKFFSQRIDLAVIDFTSSKSYTVAKIGNSDNSEKGSGALVADYPRSDRAVPIYNLCKGRVVANSSKGFDEGYGIVYSSNTLPGMSGGGVFNDLGELQLYSGA